MRIIGDNMRQQYSANITCLAWLTHTWRRMTIKLIAYADSGSNPTFSMHSKRIHNQRMKRRV